MKLYEILNEYFSFDQDQSKPPRGSDDQELAKFYESLAIAKKGLDGMSATYHTVYNTDLLHREQWNHIDGAKEIIDSLMAHKE